MALTPSEWHVFQSCLLYSIKYAAIATSAAPISGPFDALIDDGITFNASIKKPKKKG